MRGRFVFLVPLLVALVWAGCGDNDPLVPEHGAAANPTGNPIGGGALYTRIVSRSTATAVVANSTQLIAALASATSGTVIYVEDDAEIDLTGFGSLSIKQNVTVASGRGHNGSRGALLYVTESRGASQLFTMQADARFTGIRLRGPDSDVGDHGYSQNASNREAGKQGSIMSGIWIGSPRVLVDNCEVWAWSNTGVAFSGNAVNATASHSYIHHCRRTGMGYGCCVGGQAYAYITANIFEACRHDVASSGFIGSSYSAQYNVALPNQQGSIFDRHGTVDPGSWVGGDAGDWTIVHHNTVRALFSWGVGVRGLPSKIHGCQVYNNWFYLANPASAIWFWSNVSLTDRVLVYDNIFGTSPPLGERDPVVRFTPSTLFGKVPLTVDFDSTGSSSPRGGSLHNYHWQFGDAVGLEDTDVYGVVSTTHTFTTPGLYNVLLTATDSVGIPITTSATITALSPTGGPYWLSLWTKDSYRGSRSGFYSSWVVVNGVSLWHDDLAGDEGWQHVLLDVTNIVGSNSAITVSLEMHADFAVTDPDAQLIEAIAMWDDVVLFGSIDGSDDFEAGIGNWRFYEIGSTTFGGQLWPGDSHGGLSSYWLSHPYRVASTAGSRCLINKTFPITPKSTVGEWHLEEGDGNYALDSSPWSHACELKNMNIPASWTTAGIKGTALNFDGIDAYLGCGATASIQSSTGSIKLWFKQPVWKQSQLFSACNAAGTACLDIGTTATGCIAVEVTNGVSLTTIEPISTNMWHLLAVVQTASAIFIFVDGSQRATTSTTGSQWTAAVAAENMRIGGRTEFFNGIIDEIFITKTILTVAEQVTEFVGMYPLAIWHLDEGSGSIISDESANGLTGTLSASGATWTPDGIHGAAISFNGTGTVSIPDPSDKLLSTGDMSVELWFRFNAISENEDLVNNGYLRVFHRGGWTQAMYLLIKLPNVGGTIAPARGDSAWDGWAGVRTVTTAAIGDWIHFIGERSGDSLRVLVNGKLEKTSACLVGVTPLYNATTTITFGQKFSGILDEVSVFARALTEGEGRVSYNKFAPKEADSSESCPISNPTTDSNSGDGDDATDTATTVALGSVAAAAAFWVATLASN